MIVYDKVCKNCGFRLSEYYNTFMLGCPHCYQTFEREISESLKKVQYQNFHTGKIPRLQGLDRELLDEYKKLISEKEKAGLEGRFSEMAELTNQIFELREELKKRGLEL